MTYQYDAFLSHNGKDKPAVKKIGDGLKRLGLNVWLDEWNLRPGQNFILEIDEAIRKSRSIVVFIGPEGIGPWERQEMLSAMTQQVEEKVPLIPVLLPGGKAKWNEIEVPGFLRMNTFVNFELGLNDEATLKRLYHGITGKEPRDPQQSDQPQTAQVPASDAVTEAVVWLQQALEFSKLTVFMGRNPVQSDAGDLLSPYQLTKDLLKSLKLVSEDYNQMLPTPETAATYYTIQMGDAMLEEKVHKLLADRSGPVPPLHRKLVEFLGVLAKRPKPRKRSRIKQLIVSTSYDLMMEQALLEAGMPFTQIVQGRQAQGIVIKEFKDVSLTGDGAICIVSPSQGAVMVPPHDVEQLEDTIVDFDKIELGEIENLQLQEYTEPILYKFHGSQDVKKSCLISTDHYYDYFWHMTKQMRIPAQISQIISNTPILFLGSCPLDQQFRFTYHTLLRKTDGISNNRRLAPQINPLNNDTDCFRQVEAKMWDKIKTEASTRYGIEILEVSGTAFLDLLIQEIS